MFLLLHVNGLSYLWGSISVCGEVGMRVFVREYLRESMCMCGESMCTSVFAREYVRAREYVYLRV